MSFVSVINQIYELSQNEGLYDDEIADIIGCSRATVNRERRRNQIPTANLNNRKDKIYKCKQCSKSIYIRRNERKQTICPECKKRG